MNFKIIKVANGFMVQPTDDISRDRCITMSEINVFNTWLEASTWLEKEFSSYPVPRR